MLPRVIAIFSSRGRCRVRRGAASRHIENALLSPSRKSEKLDCRGTTGNRSHTRKIDTLDGCASRAQLLWLNLDDFTGLDERYLVRERRLEERGARCHGAIQLVD